MNGLEEDLESVRLARKAHIVKIGFKPIFCYLGKHLKIIFSGV